MFPSDSAVQQILRKEFSYKTARHRISDGKAGTNKVMQHWVVKKKDFDLEYQDVEATNEEVESDF
jgi:hypothetical protein